MPKRRRGLPGAGRKPHFHGLTGELTGPGILIVAIEKCLEVFARNHHQGARFLAKTPAFVAVKHAPACFHSKKSMIAHDGS